jgi:hypothetical protein
VPLILRKIRKNKWCNTESLSWLQEGEIQADAFNDVATKSNTLSVWEVADDKSDLEQVIIALASSCDNLSNLDYAVINSDLLKDIGIQSIATEGNTIYSKANPLHRDLVDLTASKLLRSLKLCLSIQREHDVQRKKFAI